MGKPSQARYWALACPTLLLTWVPSCVLFGQSMRHTRLDAEPLALANLKRIAAAEAAFRQRDPVGDRPSVYGTLAELTAVGLIDSELATGWRHSYAFTIDLIGQGASQHFVATASPVPIGSEHVQQTEDG